MTFEEWWNTKCYPARCKGNCKEAFNAGYETGKVEAEADLATVAYMQGVENQKKKTDKKLTKAKSIITTFLGLMQTFEYGSGVDNFITEVEQFLKE